MINTRARFSLLSVAFLLAASPFAALADGDKELQAFKAAIRAQYDLKEKAYNSKDAVTIVSKFYTEDAVSVPPGNAVIVGREKLLESYKQHMDGKARIVSFKTYLNGNSGHDWTNFHVTPDDPTKKPYVLKMLFMWEKRNGEWVSIGDMFMPGAFPTPEGGAK